MFKIQDGSGRLFNEVQNPAVVYDAQGSVLLKIGEWENMMVYYNYLQELYRNNGLSDVASDICLMELPKDQEEIDKVFQICDYIGVLHKKALN